MFSYYDLEWQALLGIKEVKEEPTESECTDSFLEFISIFVI